MADNNNAYSLRDCSLETLLKASPIRVPKIQRDYAQGRNNDVANDIRSKFVHDLVTAISPAGEKIELDFVYGSYRNGSFEPLDGQQRLTTLFLLHWICGVDLYVKDKKISKLSYETRNTSTDFCLELVKHSPKQFITEIEQSVIYKNDCVKSAEEKLKELMAILPEDRAEDFPVLYEKAKKELTSAKSIPEKSFSSMIQNRDWFNYLWRFDPTVQSMLVMLDAIHREFISRNLDIDTCKENLGRITFSDLDLGSFDLSDELFIKMNARGKQLSSFDIVKSTLEEEIQVQKTEKYCNTEIESVWRSLIDGEWIDWFWNQFASENIGPITQKDEEYRQRLGLAKTTEEYLKRIILRIITLQLVQVDNLDDTLLDFCYKDSIDNLNRFLIVYNDSLRNIRAEGKIPSQSNIICFSEVIKDIKSLYYKDSNSVYKDIFSLIPKEFNINYVDPNISYLDLVLADKFNNDSKIVFYALLQYAKLVPIVVNGGVPDLLWVENFSEWAHFCRNLFMNENNNTRIDDFANFKTALGGVDQLIEQLRLHLDRLAEDEAFSTIEFIRDIGESRYKGVDNQSLAEEVLKAKLKISDQTGEWKKSINAAEAHSYLWGQIRSLLSWADGNRERFDDYFRRFSEYYAYSRQKDCEEIAYAGILSVYPDHGFKNNKLYLFSSKERDYGFKRYLRDEGSKGPDEEYAPAMKATLDKWRDNYSASSVVDFIQESINSMLQSGHNYVNCILDKPTILNDAWYKMIFTDNGHYVIAQRKTASSHCYDIALDYLYYTYDKKNTLSGDITFYDSVAQTHKHAILLPYGPDKLLIKAIANGGYELIVNEVPQMEFINETEMLDYILSTYPA